VERCSSKATWSGSRARWNATCEDTTQGADLEWGGAPSGTADGPQEIEMRYADHEKVDGVLLPHRATIDTDAATILGSRRSRIIAALRYEHNVDIPAGRFALPDEIVALVAETMNP